MRLSIFVGRFRRSATPTIDIVDDPDGRTRLVRLRGRIGSRTLVDLLTAGTEPQAPRRVHLDLIDARIPGILTMRELERIVDHVERQGVALRVVGLDPKHPAITH